MKRALMILVMAAVAVGLVGSPASAQTKTRKDKVGDAPAMYDLRSAAVRNGESSLVIKTRFTTVKKRRTGVYSFVAPPGAGDRVYVVDSFPVARGRYKTVLVKLTDLDQELVPCPGLTARWTGGKRGTARVEVPQTCFGADAGRFQVQPTGYDKKVLGGLPDELMRGDADSADDFPVDPLGSVVTVRRG